MRRKKREMHGMTYSPEYSIWKGMLKRCYNTNSKWFHNYGGRGITVSNEWRLSFKQFLADIGRRPDPRLTLERIDNEIGYCKENCRWASRTEQNLNKRYPKPYLWNGKYWTLIALSEEVGIKYKILHHRIMRGWDLKEALTRPPRKSPLK